MENCTNSTTNCSVPDSTDPVLFGPGFITISTIPLILWTIFTIALIVITITTLCVAHSVAKLVRVFLINLLVARLVNTLFRLCREITTLVLSFVSVPPPPLGFCRFITWGLLTHSVVVLYSLTAFSFIVLLIVRYNKKDIKKVYICILMVVVWTIPVLLTTHILVPQVFAFQYYDGIFCYPKTFGADIILEARYSFTAICMVFTTLIPFSTSVAILIAIWCFVRRNTTAEGSAFNRRIAKFTLFLLIANSLCVFLKTFCVSVYYELDMTTVYMVLWFGSGLQISAPILVIMFLKPVRDSICSVFCFCCRHSQPVYMANKPLRLPLIEK